MNLTLVVATKNSERYLAESLESARRCIPEDRGVEILIVDAASDDDSLAIVRRITPSARIVQQESEGLYGALNDGVRHAAGDRIMFLHSDDLILGFDTKLLTSDLGSVFYGHTVFLDDEGNRLMRRKPPLFRNSWLRHFPFVFHPNAIYPTQLLREYPFNPSLHGRKADMAQIACLGNVARFERTDGIEYGFRIHAQSTTFAANQASPTRPMLFWVFRSYLFALFEDHRLDRIVKMARGNRLWQ